MSTPASGPFWRSISLPLVIGIQRPSASSCRRKASLPFSPKVRRDGSSIPVNVSVRRRGHAVRLTIAGLDDSLVYDRVLRDLIARHASWITLHRNVERAALLPLIARHRYGIHANPREPFGMAVAELAAGGCLVFTPNRGGVTEIVRDPRLRFATTEEGVGKICRVLAAATIGGGAAADDGGSDGIAELRRRLAADLPDLSVETFQRRIRQLAGVG